MTEMQDIRDRLITLEVSVKVLSEKIDASSSDRTWLVRIVLGGLVSAVLLWITKGGLFNVVI